MMPFCSWRRCKRVGLKKVDVKVEFEHPYLCEKHYAKLLKLLGIKPTTIVNNSEGESE